MTTPSPRARSPPLAVQPWRQRRQAAILPRPGSDSPRTVPPAPRGVTGAARGPDDRSAEDARDTTVSPVVGGTAPWPAAIVNSSTNTDEQPQTPTRRVRAHSERARHELDDEEARSTGLTAAPTRCRARDAVLDERLRSRATHRRQAGQAETRRRGSSRGTDPGAVRPARPSHGVGIPHRPDGKRRRRETAGGLAYMVRPEPAHGASANHAAGRAESIRRRPRSGASARATGCASRRSSAACEPGRCSMPTCSPT